MNAILRLELEGLSERAKELIRERALEWDCSEESAAVRLLDESAEMQRDERFKACVRAFQESISEPQQSNEK